MHRTQFKFGIGFCLILSLEPFNRLRYIGFQNDRFSDRWTAQFCAARPDACTLDAADLDQFLDVMKRQIRRYRAACDKRCLATIAGSLEPMFWAIFDLIERCLDLDEAACLCPMEWRLHRAEVLGPILMDIPWAMAAIGADIEPIAKALNDLAYATTDFQEHQAAVHGPPPPFAKTCPSLAARADRLAIRFFDAVNDLHCHSWRRRGW